MTKTSGETKMRPDPDPPFYRGEEVSAWCDRLMPSGDACDEEPAYEAEWLPTERDGGTTPLSAVCEGHARDVDRNLIRRIRTYP